MMIQLSETLITGSRVRLTRSSLRSPPLLGCHSAQVSVREEVCGVGDGACVTACLRRCLSLRSKPRCLEGK